MEDAQPTIDPIPLSAVVARVLAGIGKLDETVEAATNDRHADDTDHETPEIDVVGHASASIAFEPSFMTERQVCSGAATPNTTCVGVSANTASGRMVTSRNPSASKRLSSDGENQSFNCAIDLKAQPE